MFIIFAGCWNMHCFSQPSSAAGSLCLFDSFFFPPRKNKTTFVQIKLSNVSFILGGVYKDVLPWHCLFWLPLRFFCHNTHNSSGLTCCSFPLTCFPPFSKPMGLMAQDLSLLPPLVVRLQRLFFFLFCYCSITWYFPFSVALTNIFFMCTWTVTWVPPLWLKHAGTLRHRLVYDLVQHTAFWGFVFLHL